LELRARRVVEAEGSERDGVLSNALVFGPGEGRARVGERRATDPCESDRGIVSGRLEAGRSAMVGRKGVQANEGAEQTADKVAERWKRVEDPREGGRDFISE
jgi:hypothetical protein